jgi:hypothetical protein
MSFSGGEIRKKETLRKGELKKKQRDNKYLTVPLWHQNRAELRVK